MAYLASQLCGLFLVSSRLFTIIAIIVTIVAMIADLTLGLATLEAKIRLLATGSTATANRGATATRSCTTTRAAATATTAATRNCRDIWVTVDDLRVVQSQLVLIGVVWVLVVWLLTQDFEVRCGGKMKVVCCTGRLDGSTG